MFPFSEEIQLENGRSILVDQAYPILEPLLTPARKKKIREVVKNRTFSISLVLENIYDLGNISACLRSAEAMGIASAHIIEGGEKYKTSNRISQGAEKWVEIRRWKNTDDSIGFLKKQGMQIIATSLGEFSIPLGEVDFSKPSALVLGNEKDGISPRMAELADHLVVIPMLGFVQSYNISVATALSLYHIYQDRMRRLGYHGDLSDRQKKILELQYFIRTQDSSINYLTELDSRGEIR